MHYLAGDGWWLDPFVGILARDSLGVTGLGAGANANGIQQDSKACRSTWWVCNLLMAGRPGCTFLVDATLLGLLSCGCGKFVNWAVLLSFITGAAPGESSRVYTIPLVMIFAARADVLL